MSTQRDFFISYTRADHEWAVWIAWQLEEAGYTTIVQAWDFRPGHNFALAMHEAARQATQTMPLLSPDYLESGFAAAEWAAAFADDPRGLERRVMPVRVRRCKLDGLLSQIVYIDLIDRDEQAARDTLLAGVAPGRAKPSHQPRFPGQSPAKPPFPGETEAQRATPAPKQQPSFTPPLAQGSPAIDEAEILQRAQALVPDAARQYTALLGVVVAGGPRRVVVRPAQLESDELRERLLHQALFGPTKIFDLEAGGVRHQIQEDTLLLQHEQASIALDEFGSVRVLLPIDPPRSQRQGWGGLDSSVLIEEDLRVRLQHTLGFVSRTFDLVDPAHQLSALAVLAMLLDAGHRAWRTRAEHLASPDRISMPMDSAARIVVQLSPAIQSRQSLADQLEHHVDDLLVRLRRRTRS